MFFYVQYRHDILGHLNWLLTLVIELAEYDLWFDLIILGGLIEDPLDCAEILRLYKVV